MWKASEYDIISILSQNARQVVIQTCCAWQGTCNLQPNVQILFRYNEWNDASRSVLYICVVAEVPTSLSCSLLYFCVLSPLSSIDPFFQVNSHLMRFRLHDKLKLWHTSYVPCMELVMHCSPQQLNVTNDHLRCMSDWWKKGNSAGTSPRLKSSFPLTPISRLLNSRYDWFSSWLIWCRVLGQICKFVADTHH